jgi:poly-gamma-glutamate capsule biosynthesis protein CapA/YwtB (metallophosphatase superfamily)
MVFALLFWAAAAALVGVYFLRGGAVDSSVSAQADATTAPSAAGPAASSAGPAAPVSQGIAATTLTSTTSSTTASSTTTSSTTTSSTTTTTEAPIPALVVAASGDVLADRQVGTYMDKNGGEAVFAEVRPLLETAHLAFLNLECPLSDRGRPDPHKEYTFLGRPALVDGLVSAGIDVVSLANNHAVDFGPAALLDTIERLDKAGVNHAGAGADLQAAQEPALLITPAGTVAVLAFTEIIHPGFPATGERAGVNPATDRKKLLAAIASAEERADFVIVSFHWGTEYTRQPSQGQRKLAHQAIDAGADLILGHHPHVIQGLELYKDRLIAYSLGDFVWDHHSRETGETVVLRVAMKPDEPPSIEAIPVYLNDSTGVPVPVTEDAADVILGRLTRLSAGLGLELGRSGETAVYGPAKTVTTAVAPSS